MELETTAVPSALLNDWYFHPAARQIHHLEGKYFLQENCPAEIAERIALLVTTGKDV